MTNNVNNDDYVDPVVPADEYDGREPIVQSRGDSDHNADYTTTGDPIDSEQHLAEEHRTHATTGNPLSRESEAEVDAEYTTPGNPFTSAQHEAEEEIPHATPGVNSAIPDGDAGGLRPI